MSRPTEFDATRLHVAGHPLIDAKLSRMRDVGTPPALFRQLLREIGIWLAYAATRDLATAKMGIETPMGPMQAPVLDGGPPALVSILRAGNGLLDGMLDAIPTAPVGFVGVARNHETLEPEPYYLKLPDLTGRLVLAVDPMLATGGSAVHALELLREAGAARVRMVSLVAAPEGVAHLLGTDASVDVVTAALDERLDARGYIVPGLGDAGDRIFGTQ
ncbi:MAG: uracil phosphoribosyltransferase [Paracoccaceae bacterium]